VGGRPGEADDGCSEGDFRAEQASGWKLGGRALFGPIADATRLAAYAICTAKVGDVQIAVDVDIAVTMS